MCTCKVLAFSQIPKALQYRSNSNSNRHVHVLASFSSKLSNLNEQIKLITTKSATTFIAGAMKRIWWIAATAYPCTVERNSSITKASERRASEAKLFLIPIQFMELSMNKWLFWFLYATLFRSSEKVVPKTSILDSIYRFLHLNYPSLLL